MKDKTNSTFVLKYCYVLLVSFSKCFMNYEKRSFICIVH